MLDSTKALQAQFTVYPKSTVLEPAFYETLLTDRKTGTLYLECLTGMDEKNSDCRLLPVDLNGDNVAEVIAFNPYGNRVYK
jgi:hypothetical protein